MSVNKGLGVSRVNRGVFNKVTAVMMLVLFITMMAVSAGADELDEAREAQKELEDQIKEEKQELDSRFTREEQLKHELSSLDRQLREIHSELGELNINISITEENIEKTSSELMQAQENLELHEELLLTRLRVMYERGAVNYIEVLLDAVSFSDFLTRFFNLRIIAQNDLFLLEKVEEERDTIVSKKEELQQNMNSLQGMRRQVSVKKEEKETTRSDRSLVLGDLQEAIQMSQQAIEDLEKDAAELSKEIEKILEERARQREEEGGSSSGYEGDRPEGKLAWPVDGKCYVSSPYGTRSDPFTGSSAFHGGIDIATYGQHNKIFAAEDGKVMFARYSSGYGNYIMIDHGGGLMTLYAHLHKMHVSGGDIVTRGQTIGLAGTTGRSTGIHLHFEVWENEDRVNPNNYL